MTRIHVPDSEVTGRSRTFRHAKKAAVICLLTTAVLFFRPSAAQADEARILDSQEVDLGDRKIIYNLVETPALRPAESAPPVSPIEAVPMTAQEADELRRWEAKRKYAAFFWVTVYDGKFSEVRWWDAGRECVIWSNVDFLDLPPFAEIETDAAFYSLMLIGWETTTSEVRRLNASAHTAAEVMPLPPASLQGPRKTKPRWIAAGPMSEDAKRAMDDLHEYFRLHRTRLTEEAALREEQAAAFEEWKTLHPATPQDTVVNFFPIRSATLKNKPAEATKE